MITLNIEKQGETITFFSEPDNTAPSLNVEVRLAPGADGPGPHIHTRQTETFNVVSGRMIATVDGREVIVEAGETTSVAPGQVHSFKNGSPTEPLLIRGTVEPALNFQWFLTEAARSAIRAGGAWKDLPLLEVAYILNEVRDEYRLAGIPFVVQDVLLAAFSRLAVRLGKTREIAPLHAGTGKAVAG